MNIDEFRKQSIPICASHKAFNKVFGIGSNKTATTSLDLIFRLLGLNTAPQHTGEILGVQAYKGNLRPLSKYIEMYDSFQDLPFSIRSIYAQVDALFPSSKFILTVRDPELWFHSYSRYYKDKLSIPENGSVSADVVKNRAYLYKGYYDYVTDINWRISVKDDLKITRDINLLFDKDHCLEVYKKRNEEVIRHFSERPNDLLVIDLTQESDTLKIVKFLGLPESLVTEMPHLYKTSRMIA